MIDLSGIAALILSFVFAASALAQSTVTLQRSGNPGCGGADLCVNFEPAETRFGTPNKHFITTTSLGALEWEVENKADDKPGCSGWSALCEARIKLVPFGREGGSAIKISTLGNDLGVSSDTQERSEIMLTERATDAVQGKVQWWALSVFVPEDFPKDSKMQQQGTTILQFHAGQATAACNGTCGMANFLLSIRPQTDSRPALIFHAFSAGFSATNSGVDRVHGQYNYNTKNGDPRSGYSGQCLFADYKPGVWYDFVHRIKWSYTDDGSHEIWMRKAGSPVKKVLNRTGINTLYYDGGRAHLKIGTYHQPVAGATSLVIDRIRRSSLSGAAGADAVRMPDFVVDLNASVTNPDGTLVGCPSDRP